MYRYDAFDADYLSARNAEFRTQVARRIDGRLTEDEFKPLRLMNGVYLQLHAYMLRVAIPYGTLNSRQMRQLALIAERFDKGYGHFTTRQNIPSLLKRHFFEEVGQLRKVGLQGISRRRPAPINGLR